MTPNGNVSSIYKSSFLGAACEVIKGSSSYHYIVSIIPSKYNFINCMLHSASYLLS